MFIDDEWLVTAPNGQFDKSENFNGLHWVQNNYIIDFEQMDYMSKDEIQQELDDGVLFLQNDDLSNEIKSDFIDGLLSNDEYYYRLFLEVN